MILILELPTAKPIIDLVKKIAKLTLFLPETVPLATEEDDIPRRIFELEEVVVCVKGRVIAGADGGDVATNSPKYWDNVLSIVARWINLRFFKLQNSLSKLITQLSMLPISPTLKIQNRPLPDWPRGDIGPRITSQVPSAIVLAHHSVVVVPKNLFVRSVGVNTIAFIFIVVFYSVT
ncbi:hypothetical protein B0H16DRAFT_1734124 [Mycena metata]|uniref:Uncharacterized protein n=1 Tax=Mycena metata TaxID=1033252 RepID=A0AAD7HWE2_9AGAR|nr:hypothetical protein B0H16DRAFT_1734124 [Mycena metata]